MNIEKIKELIEAALPDATVIVNGDGRHFQACVISDVFKDKRLIEQHQIVYKAIGDKMGAEIHALSIKTYTEQQWQQQPFKPL